MGGVTIAAIEGFPFRTLCTTVMVSGSWPQSGEGSLSCYSDMGDGTSVFEISEDS